MGTLQEASRKTWTSSEVREDIALGAQLRIAEALEKIAASMAGMDREAFRTRIAIERLDRRLAQKIPLR